MELTTEYMEQYQPMPGSLVDDIEPMYLKPAHPYAYHHTSGKYGLILGMKMIKPTNFPQRPCYQVIYPDGEIDFVPVLSVSAGHYEIVEKDAC